MGLKITTFLSANPTKGESQNYHFHDHELYKFNNMQYVYKVFVSYDVTIEEESFCQNYKCVHLAVLIMVTHDVVRQYSIKKVSLHECSCFINQLRKRDKMCDQSSILSLFLNEFINFII